jgi:hypothetical protein
MQKTKKLFLAFFLPFYLFQIPKGLTEPLVWPIPREKVLAEHVLDLNERLPDSEKGNEVFKYNILLNLKYLEGNLGLGDSFTTEVELQPEEVFAYHENLLPEFQGKQVKTSETRFIAQEGYQAFWGLYGNGVCHLASLMNWTASDAGLKVTALANHNFWPIPGVPKEFGTSIRYLPNDNWRTRNQNLYIENPFEEPVKLVFYSSPDEVKLKVIR